MDTQNDKKEIPKEYYHYQELTFFQRLFGHLGTVHTHRKTVREGCFKVGLYYQGLTHDLSKYAPVEFIPSVKYYDGHRSPNAVARRFEGYSAAWLHHKGINKHHFEYWIDFMGPPLCEPFGCKMPLKYVAEMVCDRRAACFAYHGSDYTQADAWNYYMRTYGRIVIHPDSKAVLEKCLWIMKEEGEDACFSYLRGLLRITKGLDYTARSLGIEPVPVTPDSITSVKG